MAVSGAILAGMGALLAPVFLLLTALAANPCGAFGDACEDNGTTPAGFVVMLALTGLAIVSLVVGVVLLVLGLARRGRVPAG